MKYNKYKLIKNCNYNYSITLIIKILFLKINEKKIEKKGLK